MDIVLKVAAVFGIAVVAQIASLASLSYLGVTGHGSFGLLSFYWLGKIIGRSFSAFAVGSVIPLILWFRFGFRRDGFGAVAIAWGALALVVTYVQLEWSFPGIEHKILSLW